MISLSLVVLTHNEEQNLPHCLRSVSDLAEKVFVVDSGSDDGTVRIAHEYGAQVVNHVFENQAQQFNWALDHLPLSTDWVLRLDADEFLSEPLRDEVRTVLPELPAPVTGLYVKRRVVFCGRWIRHGGYYPVWLLRLFRRGKARSEMLAMDEHIVLLEGEARRLWHDLVDHNRKDLSFWTMKHDRFATRQARVLLWRGAESEVRIEARLGGQPPERRRWYKTRIYDRLPLFVRAFLYFNYRYFLRFGFLDGVEGLVFHVLQAFWYRFYVDAKLWELRRSVGDGSA